MVEVMSCEELCSHLIKTLNSYLASNGGRLIALARASNQLTVKLSVYGLIRYYSPLPNYPKLVNLLKALNECGPSKCLSSYGLELIEEDEVYLRIPTKYVEELLNR